MFKKILTFLTILALVLSLAACSKDSKESETSPSVSESAKENKKAEQSEPEKSESEKSEPEKSEPSPSVSQPADESEKPDESAKAEQSEPESEPGKTEQPPAPDPEPGVPAPDVWPKDIPTPVNGEILGGGWIQRIFYTADIVYKQADIDAYGERLESFGFARQEEHEYGEDWPDATVYSNGHWDVIVAEENEVFDYSYVNFYPLFDVVTDGYEGQPEGWPDTGDFQ
ncbi:MAG: hypothetical protein ACOX3H_00070 [Saccharofermentanales bacterium]|jgi:DNA mismatch repair ATPase MutL